MVRGCTGSVTSASTFWLEPCSVIRASCAAGDPVQLACMAAQDGTATGLAEGLGLGDGLGSGVGVGVSRGLGEGLAIAGGDGLLWMAALELAQPATASTANPAAS